MTHTETSDKAAIEMGDTHLTIRRIFDAPKERVFRTFTNPEELEKWYAPGDVTTQVHTLDPGPDGTLFLRYQDGEDRYEYKGTFVEVDENERLVYTWRWVNGPSEMESLIIVEFRDVDTETEVVFTQKELPSEHVEHTAHMVSNMFRNLDEIL